MRNHFAVMGNPVSHSLSPLIHQHFAKQTGIQLSYEKRCVSEATFTEQVVDFFRHGGKGLNITAPFKEKAYQLAIERTTRAIQAKAANTLWLKSEKLHADNTDGIGLVRDLSAHLDLTGLHVLLIGAGGAARGIIGPLLATKITQLTVANRSPEKAVQLCKEFSQLKATSLGSAQGKFDLIINATSASLTSEKLQLPEHLLKSSSFCYDLTYRQDGITPFVAWALQQGVKAEDGLGMLVEQAAEAFFIWHGLKPDTRSLIVTLKKQQTNQQKI